MVDQRKRHLANIEPGMQDPVSYAVSQRDRATLEMVQEAITHRESLLAYQPIVLASDHNRVGFYEALMRILDPAGRVIPAGEFMPVVEDTQTGREIDTLALRMGLESLGRNPSLRLSINMSARSIGYRPWLQTLQQALGDDPTLGERLILEITERSAMTVPELVGPFMEQLHPRGVCFAMDDFGAGHCAIHHFRDFYFDILKIDGQFVTGIARNADNRSVTAALLSIARNFEMLTVAECVENAEDAASLGRMGADCLQGYFFSAPTTQPPWMALDRRRAG